MKRKHKIFLFALLLFIVSSFICVRAEEYFLLGGATNAWVHSDKQLALDFLIIKGGSNVVDDVKIVKTWSLNNTNWIVVSIHTLYLEPISQQEMITLNQSFESKNVWAKIKENPYQEMVNRGFIPPPVPDE